jgi:hypothetical protein
MAPAKLRELKEQLQDLLDKGCWDWCLNLQFGEATNFHITDDDVLRQKNYRLCVPNDEELSRDILEEVHQTLYMVHPDSTKMY